MPPRIAMSSGHGLHIRGARGNPVPPQLDEVDEARRVVERVADFFSSAGVACATFHDDTSYDQNTNLHTITNWHNRQTRDYDVSVHFNAYNHTAHGVEVLYVTQEALAARVSAAISAAGPFVNRGAKYRSDLYVLNNTDEPAILIEMCFCDHTGDSESYRRRFDIICHAIAESIAGIAIPDLPGERPPEQPPEQPPAEPHDPWTEPIDERAVIGRGDSGHDVEDLQRMLPRFAGEVDGDFGPVTEDAVIEYQRSRGLAADGIAGPNTWGALYARRPALPPQQPLFTTAQQHQIMDIANDSAIAEYAWRNRGVAPTGYTQGMALAFAAAYRRLLAGHPAAEEMAKARTESDKDALHLYRADFERLGMSNEQEGADVLRHLYALMIGHGMRESSGAHCAGRDMSASNVQSDTAEAGLFQTSYNAHSASAPEFADVMAEYAANDTNCFLSAFAEDVSCSSSDWDCFGSGAGYQFQQMCKECPAFACETAGLTLRNLANHYGPIIRHETELRADADRMLREVQTYVDTIEAVA